MWYFSPTFQHKGFGWFRLYLRKIYFTLHYYSTTIKSVCLIYKKNSLIVVKNTSYPPLLVDIYKQTLLICKISCKNIHLKSCFVGIKKNSVKLIFVSVFWILSYFSSCIFYIRQVDTTTWIKKKRFTLQKCIRIIGMVLAIWFLIFSITNGIPSSLYNLITIRSNIIKNYIF